MRLWFLSLVWVWTLGLLHVVRRSYFVGWHFLYIYPPSSLPLEVNHMWCARCGVRDVVCAMWCARCGVRDVVCAMWCARDKFYSIASPIHKYFCGLFLLFCVLYSMTYLYPMTNVSIAMTFCCLQQKTNKIFYPTVISFVRRLLVGCC